MSLSRSLFFLTTLLIIPAKDALADANAPPAAPLPTLHIQIVDPGQKAVYDGMLRDLPDSRRIKGGWVKEEAIRCALERDPDLAIRALQMVAHPGEVPAADQAATTQEQFNVAINVLQDAPPLPLPDAPPVSVASLAWLADAARPVMAYWLKQQGTDPAQAKRDLMNMVENQPGVVDTLVGQIRDNLSDPTISSDLISMDGKLRGQLEGLVKEGKLPDINGDPQHLVDGLQPNAVTEKLASLLAGTTSEQITDMRDDQAKMLAFFAQNRDALLDQSVVLGDLQKKTDALIANAAAQKLREEHDQAVAEARGGVATAAGLLRLIDPHAAQAANDIQTLGNAVIAGEEAISSLAAGFNFAASGNLIGAVNMIANLFGSHEDIGAIRQQQIMDGLSHISWQLGEISQKLDIIDSKLTSIQKTIDRIPMVNSDQFHATMSELAEISRNQNSNYDEELRLAAGFIQHDILVTHADCARHMRNNEFARFNSMSEYLADCLTRLAAKTPTDAVNPAIDFKDFALDAAARGKVKPMESYPAMLVGPMVAVAADAHGAAPNFGGVFNSDVWYWGLQSYIDLLYLAPPLDEQARHMVAKDLGDFRRDGTDLKLRIDEFDAADVGRNLVAYDDTFDDLFRNTLHSLRTVSDALGPDTKTSVPDAFLAGFGLEELLLAARCRRVMPDFFVKYHAADTDGLLLSVCAEGTPIDFQKAGGGLVAKMPLNLKDLVVAADAMGLIEWQFEDKQSFSPQVDKHAYQQQLTAEPPIRFLIVPFFTAHMGGNVVVRYTARLKNGTVVAYYEAGRQSSFSRTEGDANKAIQEAANDQEGVKASLRSDMKALKGKLQSDFAARGDAWKALHAAADDPSLVKLVADKDLRQMIESGASDWRKNDVHGNPAFAGENVVLDAMSSRLDDLYVKIKVPLSVKYGTCGQLNPSLHRILGELQDGEDYRMRAAQSNSWKERFFSRLRKIPIDPISVQSRDDLPLGIRTTLGARALFDDAATDLGNADKYRTCDFGLPTLNAGLTLIDRYFGLPH